jgi:pimeloyl-ACP methyl ester carboxylesterase
VLLHGTTFDRRMWHPALEHLGMIDPGRRVLALDLPGHGESPDSSSYTLPALVERIHEAVVEADLRAPVVVGHSGATGTATLYAAEHATRGVVAVEGTLRVGGFAELVQSLEPMLRGPGFDEMWSRISGGVFGLDEVTPEVRDFVLATSRPRQEIVLGYWQDLFDRTPEELEALVVGGAAAIRQAGITYLVLTGHELSPEDSAWMRTLLPDARTEVWTGSGHFPHLAHPQRFAELLAETAQWVQGSRA